MQFRYMLIWSLIASSEQALTQISNSEKDSVYIYQVEGSEQRHKVLHAEPLYIDLIRDLGARKGEQEWNVGLGMTDKSTFDSYEALIEYEWAPLDRLGLEIELPFTFYLPLQGQVADSVPASRLNSLKIAGQWSFWVHEKSASTMAIGYIHEFKLSSFRAFSPPFFTGNTFNPFLIAAKRWGTHFHTLLYTGPSITHRYGQSDWKVSYEINSSFHYMIPGTRNFVGIEVNQQIEDGIASTVLRPQLRLGITQNLLIGILVGIPTLRSEGMNAFVRLIWEPIHQPKIPKGGKLQSRN